MDMTPDTCRAVRAWLKMSRPEWANVCGISLPTLMRYENDGYGSDEVIAKIHAAFVAKGFTISRRGKVERIERKT